MELSELGLTEADITPETITQSARYKALEERAYSHIEFIQLALDAAMNAGDFSDLRTYVSGIKDLTSTYNDLSRQRQMAEISEGKMLPMEILDRYKNEFYPRLQKAVDEMRISIENLLPTSMVPEFKSAWNRSYYRYTDGAREAENAINDYKIIAQEEALYFANQKDNNRLKASNAVKANLEEKKRKEHNAREAKNRQRTKEKKAKK
jgi:hypothetical protein